MSVSWWSPGFSNGRRQVVGQLSLSCSAGFLRICEELCDLEASLQQKLNQKYSPLYLTTGYTWLLCLCVPFVNSFRVNPKTQGLFYS